MALLPPGGLPEIVFSFDTTGSMSSCLKEVRGRLQDMIQRLQADIPAIRIAVFAHGDYCDRHNYVTKYVDFSDDVKTLCDFINNVSSTGGGDSDECYELVLRQVHEELSWTPRSNRSLVMIGDASPHEPDYPDNKDNIDWRVETDILAKMGVRIYAVDCNASPADQKFYKTIAEKTSGQHLKLNSFSNIFDFLMAICYREQGQEMLQVYEKEVRARCGAGSINKDLDGLFTALHDIKVDGVISPVSSFSEKPVEKTSVEIDQTDLKVRKLCNSLRMWSFAYRTPTAVKKDSKHSTKPRKPKASKRKLPLLRRESVPESNFMLSELSWTPWLRVISPNALKDGNDWQKRRGEGLGYRRKTIFAEKTNVSALYEIAVQTCTRGKRFVVYQKFVRKLPDVNWERRLLGRRDIKTQVDQIVKRCCDIFVRRVVFRRAAAPQNISSSLQKYDYAWRKRPNHRSVYIGRKMISDEEF